MSRKVYVNVVTRLIIRMDDGVEVNEVLENMDYGFDSTHSEADIESTEIKEWNVIDSK
jgi:hypothetical protein